MKNIDRRDALKIVLGGVGGLAVAQALPGGVAEVAAAQSPAQVLGMVQVMRRFPTAGRYEIHSQPIFKVSKGGESEVIVCQGKLVIQTTNAFTTEDKRRRVNVDILELKAIGTSKLLGGPVEISLSQNELKKYAGSSYFEALAGNDFPAAAHFAVPYELKSGAVTVKGLTGVMKGNIRAFPPLPADMMAMEHLELDELGAGQVVASLGRNKVKVDPIAWAC